MKLTLHLIDDNRLVAAPHDEHSGLSLSRWQHLTDQLTAWNDSGRVMVCPVECEIIDMRTPQKEQIEAIVNDRLQEATQQIMAKVMRGSMKAIGG